MFKKISIRIVVVFLLIIGYSLNASAQQSGELTITPKPYDRGIRNPMMGFTSQKADNNYPWASTHHVYIEWNELEDHESDGMDKILTVSNSKFANLAAQNRKAIPRVYLHWSGDERKYWPSDMTKDDYTSQQFKDRVVSLIERLGIAWDNDPRIAFIEMGIFGLWGEQHGPSPTESVAIAKHRDFVINSIRWLHCTQLRWIAAYDKNNPKAVAGAEEMQKAFGYRYVLNEVRVSMDDSLSVSFDVTNEGSAPFYYDWPIEVALLDANTLKPIWKSVMKNADIRTWHPGSGWSEPEWLQTDTWAQFHANWTSTGTTGWANPLQKNTVQEKFKVNAPQGNYVLSLAVLDPAGMLPSLRFATANYINGGRHPIALINTTNYTIQDLPQDFQFDDLFSDNSLYYEDNL